MAKRISIIIPIYENSETMLDTCLASVNIQMHDNLAPEVILVQDGGTTDYSFILDKHNSLNILFFSLHANTGLSFARNLGVSKASGDYVLFLDADDCLAPDSLNKILMFIDRDGPDLCFSNFIKYDSNFEVIERYIDSTLYYSWYTKYYDTVFNPIFHSIFIGHAFVVKRKTFDSHGGFNESIDCGEITDMALRLFSSKCNIKHINSYLYYYRNNPCGLSKLPHLNANRMNSIWYHFEKVTGNSLSAIKPLGRIAPYNHMHFNLFGRAGNLMSLPYLNYKTLALKGEDYVSHYNI